MNEKWQSRQWFLTVWYTFIAIWFRHLDYITSEGLVTIMVALTAAWGGREISKAVGKGGGLEKYAKFYKK
jgi:hypothetical protein